MNAVGRPESAQIFKLSGGGHLVSRNCVQGIALSPINGSFLSFPKRVESIDSLSKCRQVTWSSKRIDLFRLGMSVPLVEIENWLLEFNRIGTLKSCLKKMEDLVVSKQISMYGLVVSGSVGSFQSQ